MGKKTGLEKTMGKMFEGASFSGGIRIAVPEDRTRMSPEERRELEGGVRPPSGATPRAEVPEPEPSDGGRGRGRPRKEAEDVMVLMNFRVPESFRQRVRMESARRGVPILDLFVEAFDLYFSKYGQER